MLKTNNLKSTGFLIKTFLFIFTILAFSFSYSLAEAATLQMSPSSGSHAVGQTFSARVIVDSGASSVNAVEATLSFNRNVLSVVSVSKAGSVINLWTTEPSFSNAAGTITFGGGNPSPFSGQSTLITVTFRVLAEGSGTVEFNSGAVTAADGTGRDVLANMRTATYTGVSAPEPTPDPTPSVGAPGAPVVESKTHPKENPWSNEYKGSFSWNVPSGVNAVRLLVGRQPQATPTVVYDPPISSRELDDDIFNEDGLWYFHVQFRNSAGWGAVTSYEFGFDTVPPKDFDVQVVEGEGTPNPTLSFKAEDELSGIGEYVIKIEGRENIVIKAEEHGENDNRYTFEDPLLEGETLIEVVAIDNAGNETSSSITLSLEERDDVSPVVAIDDEEEIGFFARHGTTIFIIFLLLIILGLLGYIWKLRKQIEQNKKKGKREITEVRNEVSRVFSALRDEAEELFASFDGKEGLSAKEKGAFKKISDALDVSEEIIGKEIDDVDKLME